MSTRVTLRQGSNGGVTILLDGEEIAPGMEVELKITSEVDEGGVITGPADLSDLGVSEYGQDLVGAEDAEGARDVLELGQFSTQDTLVFGDPTILTVASGVITATGNFHTVAGEGGNADDLVTINGTVAGQLLVLSASDDADTITVKNGTGNVFLAGSDFAMDNLKDRLVLISDGTNLYELSRANNGA